MRRWFASFVRVLSALTGDQPSAGLPRRRPCVESLELRSMLTGAMDGFNACPIISRSESWDSTSLADQSLAASDVTFFLSGATYSESADGSGWGDGSDSTSGDGSGSTSGSGDGDGSGSASTDGSGSGDGSGTGSSDTSGSGSEDGSGSGDGDGSGSSSGDGSGSVDSEGSGSGSTDDSSSGDGSGPGAGDGSGAGGSDSSGSGSGDGSGSGSASSTSSSQPPLISGFTWSRDDSVLRFYGLVTDDVDPTGLSVTFGGMLEGTATSVLDDDTFIFEIQADSTFHGTVTAQVTDGDGLTSNLVATFV